MQNETLNEQSGSPRDSRNGAINNGMSVSSVVPVSVKKVDEKNLVTGEDTRAQAAPAVLPANPPVRSENNDAQGS